MEILIIIYCFLISWLDLINFLHEWDQKNVQFSTKKYYLVKFIKNKSKT